MVLKEVRNKNPQSAIDSLNHSRTFPVGAIIRASEVGTVRLALMFEKDSKALLRSNFHFTFLYDSSTFNLQLRTNNDNNSTEELPALDKGARTKVGVICPVSAAL